MNLKSLRKSMLLLLARELNLEVSDSQRKPELIEAILALGAEDDELSECVEEIQERQAAEAERKAAAAEAERKAAEAEADKMRKHELEMKRLELEISHNSRAGGSEASGTAERVRFKMTDLMRSYKLGEDIGLFLVNFERTCERQGFSQDTWPQRLLSLLPGEASEVIARLTKEEADEYSEVKSSLLKKYRLSAEGFRQKFRNAVKENNDSYPEFAYKLMANMGEWLKEAKAYGNHDKVLECIGLEQFYQRLPEKVRFWVQDRPDVNTVTKAAELAEEFVTRRALGANSEPKREKFLLPNKAPFRKQPTSLAQKGEENNSSNHGASAEASKRKFEARKPAACFNCHETGHFAKHCPKEKVAFLSINEADENMKLLEPYMYDLTVNGKQCRVLRDSAATMDVVHPSFVQSGQYSGDCAWIRQAVEANSQCLPVAKVVLKGAFGTLETEAAVSPYLPPQYPYLFSNKSDQMLKEKGLTLGEGIVQALTRSKARALAARATFTEANKPQIDNGPGCELDTTVTNRLVREQAAEAVVAEATIPKGDDEPPPELEGVNYASLTEQIENAVAPKPIPGSTEDSTEGDTFQVLGTTKELCVMPTSDNFSRLLQVSPASLITEQKGDPTLKQFQDSSKEGIAKRNVRFQERSGILYRKYLDRRGVEFDQVVVPQAYRQDLLSLVHGESWSGHLGVKKTKNRLLQEYYWPGCFKDVERFVKSCDVCQRVGKPGDKAKFPMKLVPVITEPFRRLVIDTVGPLPKTTSGYRHILTLICPATKFPEAVPLKELSSVEVVNALLSVFARVGFPAEIQSDQGTIFTSALTTTFLERCGVKLLHSSVYHPQSNSIEKLHSVMKRVLRALCFERKTDWEMCLPATMFALRTAPHETTGFTPAELVYGRRLRSPLRMLRESWEGQGDDPVVVEYVLTLLDRLTKAQELTESAMTKAQQKAKLYYDRTAKARHFAVGDRVMLLRPSQKNKLEVQWVGPAEITRKLSDTNYVVKLPGSRKVHQVYHSNLLKPYKEREAIVNMTLNVPEEVPAEIPELAPESDEVPIEKRVEDLVSKSQLTMKQKQELRGLLTEFQDRFVSEPGRTSVLTHDIELTSSEPVRSKTYRVSPRRLELIKAEVNRMLELGVIEPCESDYTSPLILVEVPGKDPRPCVDYRKLNLITKDQTYPIPHIEERVERVSSAQFISTLDLVRGYWQVPLTERASRYAAFISPLGTFRPKVLSFGLKNAPYCFSNLMDKVLRGQEDFALPYLDDVAVFSSSWPEHLAHLRAVLTRLREAGLTVKAPKCQLAQAEVLYLGHVIGRGHRRPSEMKVAAIRDFPQPRTKTDIRAFLGIAGYYRKYIPRYSDIASTLTDALRKTEPQMVDWDEEKEKAFRVLKAALSSQPLLSSPDYSRPFIVQCDASDRGMGAVLSQRDEGDQEHPVLYVSRKLTLREQVYSASEKECACLVWAVQKLACYIAGSKFIVEVDHCPLTWLQTMSSKNGRLLRWSLVLQQYTFEIRYKKGVLHGNADGLSRCP